MKRWLVLFLLMFAPLAHATTCDQWAVGTDSTSGATQIVALQQGARVYVCSLVLTTSITTANTVQLQYGTGTACATGTGNFGLAIPFQAVSGSSPAMLVDNPGANVNWGTPVNQALCLNLSASTTINYEIHYAVF